MHRGEDGGMDQMMKHDEELCAWCCLSTKLQWNQKFDDTVKLKQFQYRLPVHKVVLYFNSISKIYQHTQCTSLGCILNDRKRIS